MIFVHNIDPILFSFGPVIIRWYSLLFIIGLISNYLILLWIFKRQKYSEDHLDSIVLYLFFGLLIGARLGHILFYNFPYFSQNPMEIFKIWHGGLSSHGAAIGVFAAYLLWTYIHKVKFVKYVDAIAIPMPLTAACVRIGNFFNSEILGKFTDGSWGVTFKKLGEIVPRHPSQIYEALLSLAIFFALFFVYKKYYKKVPPLFITFLFIFLYFATRFIVEYWKDMHFLPESFPLSTGQVLSIIPVLISLIYFVFYFPRMKSRKA